MKRLAVSMIAIAAALGSGVAAQAQSYPSKPITIITGFPPGGPTDTVARIMSEHMKTTLGQPVLVEPVSGASGTIASAKVAQVNTATRRVMASPLKAIPPLAPSAACSP